jgi:hypothetical protein
VREDKDYAPTIERHCDRRRFPQHRGGPTDTRGKGDRRNRRWPARTRPIPGQSDRPASRPSPIRR